MTALARLSGRLTLPYRRGAEFAAIPLGADVAGATAFAPYDFAEYRARWGQDPTAPLYVIAPRTDVAGDDLILKIAYTGAAQPATLTIPRATHAGTGFPIPLASGTDATVRLISLTVAPSLGIAGSDAWEVVALLGTIAKLLWILGSEKDAITRVRHDVRNARFVKSAVAAGLDALGKDMGVSRFPPRPYSVDDATIALWHLDEVPDGGPVTVADQTMPGHPGMVAGATAGVPGKYGTGFAFLASGSAITVAPSTDFDIAVNADATIEVFVTTDIPGDQAPRAIVVRRAAETITGSNTPGWSLCVVNARGFNANILFALCDGALEVRLFADLSVADGRFHHIAGIVDRSRQRARLFVDGVQRAIAPIDALGAVAPPDGVRFGSTSTATNNLSGTIDEVRISRVARATFHPALGEDDEAYRARLRIFRRWVLPTPANVIAMINEAAPFPSDPAPYILIEANQPTQVAESPVRIVPATLAAGAAIAVDGATPQDETVAGTPANDPGFDPSFDLITYANAGVDASTDPGGARMQAGVGHLLDALVAAATPGTVILEHSFDTAGPTPLHSVGRALRLRHSTLGSDVLGALAHRVGFAYVRNLSPHLAVAVPAGERIAIRSAPTAGRRADVGAAFDLTVDPPLSSAGIFSWTIITPGPARARLVGHSADLVSLTTNGSTANATLHFVAVPATILSGMVIVDLTTGAVIPSGATVVSKTATTVVMSQNVTGPGVGNGDSIQFSNPTPIPSRPRVRLVTDTPGDLAVRVEYSRRGRTRSGTLSLRVDPTTLADGHAIDTIGNADPDLSAIAGTPDAGFDPAYLVTHAATAAIDFGADPNNAKMQVVSRDALDGLVALLAARATPGQLQVTQAFVPGGVGVESVGRRLVLGHTTLDPGVLAALAARFFDYVARAGASVSAFMRPDTWIEIGDAATTAPLPAEILLGTPLTTNALTAAANATLNFAAVPGTILPGMAIVDLTAAAAIPAGTTVVSKTATTVVMSQTATGAGVGAGNVIQFGTPLNLAAVPSTLPPGTYNWSTRAIGAGAGSFDTLVRPTAHFTPLRPGLVTLALTYVQTDPSCAAPYTFEIRLKPTLDVPATNIPKAQYDIIMNVLDAFHPIGIEVRTDNIRKHVRELEQDPTKAFPAYSFPNFRV